MENENLPSISHERIASFEKEIGDKERLINQILFFEPSSFLLFYFLFVFFHFYLHFHVRI